MLLAACPAAARPAPLHIVSDGRRPRLLAGWAMDRAGCPVSCLVLAGWLLASTPQIVTGLTIEVEKQLHDTNQKCIHVES